MLLEPQGPLPRLGWACQGDSRVTWSLAGTISGRAGAGCTFLFDLSERLGAHVGSGYGDGPGCEDLCLPDQQGAHHLK